MECGTAVGLIMEMGSTGTAPAHRKTIGSVAPSGIEPWSGTTGSTLRTVVEKPLRLVGGGRDLVAPFIVAPLAPRQSP